MRLFFRSVVLSCAILAASWCSLPVTQVSALSSHLKGGIKIQLNDKLVHFPDEAQPFIDDESNTQVPIRFITDMLGYDVHWEMEDEQVRVKLSNGTEAVELKTGETKAVRNGEEIELPSPALFKQGRTYVPIRFLAELTDSILQWDQNNRIAILGLDGEYHAPAWYAPEVEDVLDVTASAYSAAASENGGWGAVDYFGNPLNLGTIAVDPDVIPLGSRLYVMGYDFNGLPVEGFEAKATDIGGSIKGNRIDIFIPGPQKEVRKFGLQKVRVYVLK